MAPVFQGRALCDPYSSSGYGHRGAVCLYPGSDLGCQDLPSGITVWPTGPVQWRHGIGRPKLALAPVSERRIGCSDNLLRMAIAKNRQRLVARSLPLCAR